MANDCFTELRKAFSKDKLSDQQIREVLTELQAIKNSTDWGSKFRKFKKRTEEQVQFVAEQKALQIVKNRELTNYTIQDTFLETKLYNDAFRSTVENAQRIIKGGQDSYFNRLETVRAAYFNFWNDALGVNKDFAYDPTSHKSIMIAVDKLNKGKSISDMPKPIQEVAEAIRKTNKNIIVSAEQGGIRILERDDYIFRQTHDTIKVSSVPRDEWIDFVYQKLNMKKTFGNITNKKEHVKILEEIYDRIAANEYTDHVGLLGGKRSIHFKDGASLYDYNVQFGEGSMMQAIERSMNVAARSESLLFKWGPKPEVGWDHQEKIMESAIAEKFGEAERRKFMDTGFGRMKSERDNLKQNIFGFNNHPERNMPVKILAVTQAVQAMSKLQMAVFSTVTDFPIAAVGAIAKTGVNPFKAHSELLSNYVVSLSKANRVKFGKLLGVHFDFELDRFGTMEGLEGRAKRFTNTVMKFTGLNFTTEVNKTAGAITASSHLASQRLKSFKDLEPRLIASMKNFNITSKDWDIIRTAGFTEAELAWGVNKSSLEILSSERMPTRELQIKLSNYIGSMGRLSSPQPGIRTRSAMNQGLSPNTIEGQAIRMALQFKSFSLESVKIAKEISMANPASNSPNFARGLKNTGNLQMLGLLMSETFAFAAIGLWGRDLATGKTPRDMTKKENLITAFTRGVLPLSLEYAVNAASGSYANYGRSFLKDLAGPSFSQVDDIARFTSLAFRDSPEGKHPAAALAIRSIVNNTPMVKNPLFYPLLQKTLLNRINEWASPGYGNRIFKRMQKNNQEFLWPLIHAPSTLD